MDLSRAFLVEKVLRLGFTEGALTHVIMRKPSEALQVAKLPLAVVDTILAVPANFFSQIGSNSEALKTEVANRKDALAAIDQRLNAIQARLDTSPDLTDSEKAAFSLKCNGALIAKIAH